MIKITNKKIIDISIPVNERTIIYPGNAGVKIETFKNPKGTSWLSKITLGSHTGTHLDAPRHVFEKGKTVDKVSLERLIGECRVVDFTYVKKTVSKDDLGKKKIKKNERILLKTKNSQRGYERFYDDYIYLSSEGAKYLAKKQITLLGIDYLSVKKKGSPDNTPHTALLSQNIPILEGIDLKKVDEGEYFLVVLPIKFIGIEGAPSRAILLT